MDIQSVRKTLSQRVNSGVSSIIKQGYIVNSSGDKVEYTVEHGLNIQSAIACNEQWTRFKLEMLDYIEKKKYSEAELDRVLTDIQTEDYHWDWALKANVFSSSEYEWFFLFADNRPQGACLIFHPKRSVLHSGNIFYVEFVAVAPWNRKNPMNPVELKGVGTRLIKTALGYAVNTLGLSQGFSLHSLPQACNYYLKIGMLNDKNYNKNGLEYFELPEKIAGEMLESL